MQEPTIYRRNSRRWESKSQYKIYRMLITKVAKFHQHVLSKTIKKFIYKLYSKMNSFQVSKYSKIICFLDMSILRRKFPEGCYCEASTTSETFVLIIAFRGGYYGQDKHTCRESSLHQWKMDNSASFNIYIKFNKENSFCIFFIRCVIFE